MDKLEQLISHLENKLVNDHASTQLRTVLGIAQALRQSILGQSTDSLAILEDLRNHLALLGDVALSKEHMLLDDVEVNILEHPAHLTSSNNPPNHLSIVKPPTTSESFLGLSTSTPMALPAELVDTLNQSYFLHLLATDPDRVLPPGKSILSMMSRSGRATSDHKPDSLPTLQEKIEDLAHRAFWDEVGDYMLLSDLLQC
jgi:hypothetical protein